MYSYLSHVSPEALYQPAAGWPNGSQTVYGWLKNLLVDGQEHVGEIKAIIAMWERRVWREAHAP
jgi:hypothetical protein